MKDVPAFYGVVGTNIAYHRKRCNLTQRQFANLLGYKSHSRITHYEKGRNQIELHTLIDMCSILKVSIADLLLPTKKEVL